MFLPLGVGEAFRDRLCPKHAQPWNTILMPLTGTDWVCSTLHRQLRLLNCEVVKALELVQPGRFSACQEFPTFSTARSQIAKKLQLPTFPSGCLVTEIQCFLPIVSLVFPSHAPAHRSHSHFPFHLYLEQSNMFTRYRTGKCSSVVQCALGTPKERTSEVSFSQRVPVRVILHHHPQS